MGSPFDLADNARLIDNGYALLSVKILLNFGNMAAKKVPLMQPIHVFS